MIYNDDISTWKHVGGEGMTVMESSGRMGPRKNLWKNSWKTMFRDLIFAGVYIRARAKNYPDFVGKWGSGNRGSIHLSVVASIFIRLVTRLNLRKVREEGGGIMSHSLNNISSDSTPSYTRR